MLQRYALPHEPARHTADTGGSLWQGVLNPRHLCAPFGGSGTQLSKAAAPLAALMATLPDDVKLLEAGDLIDQLALWLDQYNFLQGAQLHDFARSLFECEVGDGVGSRKSRGKRVSRKKKQAKKTKQSSTTK